MQEVSPGPEATELDLQDEEKLLLAAHTLNQLNSSFEITVRFPQVRAPDSPSLRALRRSAYNLQHLIFQQLCRFAAETASRSADNLPFRTRFRKGIVANSRMHA
jgi:hypothetical protein